MASIDVLESDPEFVIATWRGAMISVWRTSMTLDRAAALRRAIERFAKVRGEEGYISISIFDLDALGRQTEEVREANEALTRDFGRFLRAAAFVLPGTGFTAATTRMVVASVMLASRAKYPTKTFEATGDAARWLASHGERYPASELQAAIDEVRAHLGKRSGTSGPAMTT